ncbi:TPA: hypothetical protein IXM35_002093 [Enterococcus faecium]|nr:hypothetical protein [Enterococcus faecium]
MNYSIQQIDEIKSIILAIKRRTQQIEDLEVEVLEINDSNKETYSISFYYSGEERSFNIPALSLLDLYESKITNLKLETLSLEKRLQELVK